MVLCRKGASSDRMQAADRPGRQAKGIHCRADITTAVQTEFSPNIKNAIPSLSLFVLPSSQLLLPASAQHREIIADNRDIDRNTPGSAASQWHQRIRSITYRQAYILLI